MKKIFRKKITTLSFFVAALMFSFVFVNSVSATDWCGAANLNTGEAAIQMGPGACDQGGFQGFLSGNTFGLPTGPADGISGILQNLLAWLLGIFGTLGVIGFVLSGIWYLLSAGEESMAEKGKEGMKWSIIGIIIGLSGLIIMRAVQTMLGGMSGF